MSRDVFGWWSTGVTGREKFVLYASGEVAKWLKTGELSCDEGVTISISVHLMASS